MAHAKITHHAKVTTVILSSGDFTREFAKDREGTFFVQRAHDGSVVKRHPIEADTFLEVLAVAQSFAAAENGISRTLKATWRAK